MGSRLIDSLATTDALADVFSDASVLSMMLAFEVGLARAEAAHGVVPAAVPDALARVTVDRFDAARLAREARASATPAIAFVAALRAEVAAIDEDAARFAHWGATSQDLIDTALVLCLQRARRVLASDHNRLLRGLRALSEAHRATVMPGRTLLQPAPPITFGLKTAGWAGGVARAGTDVAAAFTGALQLQFGGASGTLAMLGASAEPVEATLASTLNLARPAGPWHTHRDRLAALVSALGVYTAALGKIAIDVALLMQTEVAEAEEPGGGSSTMPHKRNPSGSAVVIAAATRTPGLVASYLSSALQAHERAAGGWQAEAPVIAAVVQTCGSALSACADVVAGLSVHADRMRAHLSGAYSVVFAERLAALMAGRVGRDRASRLVRDAVAETTASARPLRAVVADMPEIVSILAPEELATIDEPEAYLGAAESFRQRLLAEAAADWEL
ncbi:MAG TPA: lyase family protein [Vicinamibacterales bacterium]|jgi:3-carboxy-cis,cis-muconate cycloisomerase|nr:lyase family protein [Vicinamibacterales bacterium]